MMIRVGIYWVFKTMTMMIAMAKKITISKVGVDPLMRQRVWEHILQVVSLGSLGSIGSLVPTVLIIDSFNSLTSLTSFTISLFRITSFI